MMLADFDYVFVARHKKLGATHQQGVDAMCKALNWIKKTHKNVQI